MHADDELDLLPPRCEVPSPCVRICRLGRDGYCEGCQRTIAEISAWPLMTPDQKRTLLKQLSQRDSKVTAP